jgi:Tol biopolymer transport system component
MQMNTTPHTPPVVAVMAALSVVAAALAVQSEHEPAEAAFPGTNGKITFVSYRDGTPEIYAMNADGTNPVNLTHDFSPPLHNEDYSPVFSPDGRRIAFESDRQSGGGVSDVWVMNADATNPVNLTGAVDADTNVRGGSPTFSPDGTRIAFVSGRDGNGEIYVMNADGTNAVRLTDNPASDFAPVFSPDGTRIAFTTDRDARYENYEIYVMNADGTNPVRLTNNPAEDSGPEFSPDGTRIAFTTNRDGNFETYVMNADGTNPVNLTNNPAYDSAPAISPDGRRIAFSTNRDGNSGFSAELVFGSNFRIYVMNIDGTNPVPLTSSPAWTPGDLDPDWGPAPPNTPPRITHIRPVPGSVVRDHTPLIAATVSDLHTNLSARNIRLFVDGQVRAFSYDRDSDRLRHTSRALARGRHIVRVQAMDPQGARTVRSWAFRVR